MSKIILDCDLMRYRNSGLYHYCLNLGRYVNDLLSAEGEELMAFYVPPSEATTFDRQQTIVEKKMHRFFKPFLFDCKVWHAPFQSGRIVPKQPSTKILLTIHDLNVLHEGKGLGEQRKSIAHTQSLIDRSDVIVCISEFTKSDVLKHCDTKTKPVYVVHNGTHAVGEPVLNSRSYKPERPFIFTMGYVNRKKNFHVLLPLVENSDMELVIAGRLDEPDYVDMMRKQAEELNISDQVRILGPVAEEEKAWYLKNCAGFVLPSLAEGFGAPVVEAMQFGKPLFLSDKTSLPEIGGDVAFYFRDFDPAHMKQVLLEGLYRHSLNGLSGRIMQRGKDFDWKNKAKEYLSIYRSLLT